MDEPEPKIIDVFICKLRRKLELAGARGVSIDTVWSQGYILRETEAMNPASSSDLPDSIGDIDPETAGPQVQPRRRKEPDRQMAAN